MQITKITKENIKSFTPLLLTRGAKRFYKEKITLGAIDDNGKAAGALCAGLMDSQADIISLYVIPEARKKGCAELMLDTLDELLSDSDLDAISAEFLEDGDSLAFYRSMGYELFRGSSQYYMTMGEFYRTTLYKKHIKDKKIIGIRRVSSFSPKKKRAFEAFAGTADYNPEWSTAHFIKGLFTSAMLADHSEDSVTIEWIYSRVHNPIALLKHLRALVQKIEEEFPGRNDIRIRMAFENELLAEKFRKLTGSHRHLHTEGHLITAIRILNK